MNILKSAVLLGFLIIINQSVSAAKLIETGLFSKEYALKVFSKTLTEGSFDHLEEILDESFHFSMLRLNDQVSLDKRYLINFYKKSKSFYLKQDCYTSSTTIMSTNLTSIIRLDLHYRTFVHTYFLSLANKPEGWKIIYVYSLLTAPNT